jgi:hypothetical protein
LDTYLATAADLLDCWLALTSWPMPAHVQARAGMLSEVMFADQLTVSRAMDRWGLPVVSRGSGAAHSSLSCIANLN